MNEKLERARTLALGNDNERSEALQLLHEASGEDCAEALYALGSWYLHGENVPQDPATAREFWVRASQLKNIDAMIELGKFFENEEFVEQDLEQAFYYNLMAALHGDGQGAYELSRFFYFGLLVPKSNLITDLLIRISEERGFEDLVKED